MKNWNRKWLEDRKSRYPCGGEISSRGGRARYSTSILSSPVRQPLNFQARFPSSDRRFPESGKPSARRMSTYTWCVCVCVCVCALVRVEAGIRGSLRASFFRFAKLPLWNHCEDFIKGTFTRHLSRDNEPFWWQAGEQERERERKDNKKPDEMREFIGDVAGRAETAEFQPRRWKFHPVSALI